MFAAIFSSNRFFLGLKTNFRENLRAFLEYFTQLHPQLPHWRVLLLSPRDFSSKSFSGNFKAATVSGLSRFGYATRSRWILIFISFVSQNFPLFESSASFRSFHAWRSLANWAPNSQTRWIRSGTIARQPRFPCWFLQATARFSGNLLFQSFRMYAADGRGRVRGKGRKGGVVVQLCEVTSFILVSSSQGLKASGKIFDCPAAIRWTWKNKLKAKRYPEALLKLFNSWS